MFFNAIRLLAQAALLICLARLLGPADLGSFVGAAGLATWLGAFSGLGMGLVMYEEAASRKAQLGAYWRLSIRATAVSGFVICLVGAATAAWLFEGILSLRVIAAIFVADVVFLPLITNAAYAMAAYERISWAAGLPAASSIARLIAVFAVWYSDVPADVERYAYCYLVVTMVVAVLGLVAVHRVLRPSSGGLAFTVRDWRRGLGFMAVWASGMGLGALDKSLVLRLGGAEVAGLYAPAYRAATLLAFPAESMSMAAMPRLFQKFGGTAAHRGLVARLFVVTAMYGMAAGAVLWVAASLVPWLLGQGFEAVADGVRWLALLVPIYALRSLGGSILMAAKMKLARGVTECCGIVAMGGLGVLLLPGGGLLAAATMIIAVEAAVAVTHWLLIIGNRRGMHRSVVSSSLISNP